LSIGGMIGQAFALNHGVKLKSLMLCDTSPGSPPDAKETWAPRIAAVTKANSLAPLADGTMERWFTEAFKARNPGRWRQIHDTIVGTTARGFLGCAAAIQNFDFVLRLPTLKIPTLVVCGADDQGTPPSANKRIAALVPGARYEEIEKARHLPNVEHPAVFNRIMMGWLDAHR
jgi:3-oxoadipate enol-lactonase